MSDNPGIAAFSSIRQFADVNHLGKPLSVFSYEADHFGTKGVGCEWPDGTRNAVALRSEANAQDLNEAVRLLENWEQ